MTSSSTPSSKSSCGWDMTGEVFAVAARSLPVGGERAAVDDPKCRRDGRFVGQLAGELGVDGDRSLLAERLELAQRTLELALAGGRSDGRTRLAGRSGAASPSRSTRRSWRHCWSNVPRAARISLLVCSIMKLSKAWRMTPRKANSVSGEHITTRWPMASSSSAGSCSWMNPVSCSLGRNSST